MMKPFRPHPTSEYRSYLDLPKHAHLGDFERYPRPEGLKNTFGWFEVRVLPGDIYAIAEPYHEQNGCFYVVLGETKALLFDAGLGIYDPRPLVEELAGGREIIVVNSHFHFDHAGGSHFFDKVYIHADDLVRKVAENGLHTEVIREQVRDEAFPMGVPEGFDQAAYGTEPFNYEDVENGQIFDLGGRCLEVFYAPGHSGDGICLIDKENDLVLAGDTFYLGALYCQFASDDFGYSDPVAYGRTMHELYGRINDGTKVFCCHNAFEANGAKIGQAAELFDKLNEMIAEGGAGGGAGAAAETEVAAGTAANESQLDYGVEGQVFEHKGDDFSVMYV